MIRWCCFYYYLSGIYVLLSNKLSFKCFLVYFVCLVVISCSGLSDLSFTFDFSVICCYCLFKLQFNASRFCSFRFEGLDVFAFSSSDADLFTLRNVVIFHCFLKQNILTLMCVSILFVLCLKDVRTARWEKLEFLFH
jgi:hypothetical protein